MDFVAAHKWAEWLKGGRKVDHTASVISDGLTPDQAKQERERLGQGLGMKVKHEKNFPMALIEAGLTIDIRRSSASMDIDRVRILNSIAGKERAELDQTPDRAHPNYERVNIGLHSLFALAGWRQAVDSRPDLLQSMSEAVRRDKDRRILSFSFQDCISFDDNRLVEVADAVHDKIQVLDLDLYLCRRVTDKGLERFATCLPADLRVLQLNLSFDRNITDEVMLRFANCNINKGVEALASHLPSELQVFHLALNSCKSFGDAEFRELATALPAKLRELNLNLQGSSIRYLRSVQVLAERVNELQDLRKFEFNFRRTPAQEHEHLLESWQPSDQATQLRLVRQASAELESDIVADWLQHRIMAPQSGQSEADVLFDTFKNFDKNGDGKITAVELEKVFRQLDTSMTSDQVATLFAKADQNRDGVIDYREFVEWLFE